MSNAPHLSLAAIAARLNRGPLTAHEAQTLNHELQRHAARLGEVATLLTPYMGDPVCYADSSRAASFVARLIEG